jgi:Rad3-related DNA helicase
MKKSERKDKPHRKNLKPVLPPLREARVILGEALMSAGSDDKLKDVFLSTDNLIEHVELATDPPHRSKPRPFDSTAMRGTGQRSLRDVLRLLREAGAIILDADKVAHDWIDHGVEEATKAEWKKFYAIYNDALTAKRMIANVIEGVRALMGLPSEPLTVLEKKRSALSQAVEEECDRVDAEFPEIHRLNEEIHRLNIEAVRLDEEEEEDEEPDNFGKWVELMEERERILNTDDRYAEMRRLKKEETLIWEEMKRILEADPLAAINWIPSQDD